MASRHGNRHLAFILNLRPTTSFERNNPAWSKRQRHFVDADTRMLCQMLHIFDYDVKVKDNWGRSDLTHFLTAQGKLTFTMQWATSATKTYKIAFFSVGIFWCYTQIHWTQAIYSVNF